MCRNTNNKSIHGDDTAEQNLLNASVAARKSGQTLSLCRLM